MSALRIQKEVHEMTNSPAVAEGAKATFWRGKIEALLKSADARQLEIIYGFAYAFLEKAGSS